MLQPSAAREATSMRTKAMTSDYESERQKNLGSKQHLISLSSGITFQVIGIVILLTAVPSPCILLDYPSISYLDFCLYFLTNMTSASRHKNSFWLLLTG